MLLAYKNNNNYFFLLLGSLNMHFVLTENLSQIVLVDLSFKIRFVWWCNLMIW